VTTPSIDLPDPSTLRFETVEPGKYRLPILSSHGRGFSILVKKEQVANPSVRGGAYRDRWVAYNGGLYVKEHGETRIEATMKALAFLTGRGFTVAPSGIRND
jgi:hypothetical protein